MFDDIRYRWELHKQLKLHKAMRQNFEEMLEDDPEKIADEPRYKWVMGRELQWEEFSLNRFRSKYLIEQAYKYHVPIPEDEASWEQGPRT